MPRVKSSPWNRRSSLIIASVAMLAVLLIWQYGKSPGQREEEFVSFQNLTQFSDQEVRSAYRFAVANFPGLLSYMPCFCGCVYHGDTNNGDCYIDGFDGQGRLLFDPHAVG
ncbi:MAG: hypothetical protein HY666_06445 [Chloroflexi bacterium]|nr:hypothetical protein [Chloroflexota bacterium]